MIAGFGFVFGTTVNSLRRKVEKIQAREDRVAEMKGDLRDSKAQAIADRMATIRLAQDDIDLIQAL